jgi:hypothetical protein
MQLAWAQALDIGGLQVRVHCTWMCRCREGQDDRERPAGRAIVGPGRKVTMVGVAQLVELRIVIPAVVGSSPIVHPIFMQIQGPAMANGPLAQLAEHRTLNPQVVGSIPTWPTNRI